LSPRRNATGLWSWSNSPGWRKRRASGGGSVLVTERLHDSGCSPDMW
jgi:hypothetical protein